MQNMERTIAHLDLDTFFVSVERRKDSRLNDKALITVKMANGIMMFLLQLWSSTPLKSSPDMKQINAGMT